jgi:GNAT superfamily N-acetyltransferase
MIVRRARPGDGDALARLHGELGADYAALAPAEFRAPQLEGLAGELDGELGDHAVLQLVAEVDGEVASALVAHIVAPDAGAEHQIQPDAGRTRLRVDYLVTGEAHRGHGLAARLVEEAEAWGRDHGATVAETWTYHRSPLSVPFWKGRMNYAERSVQLRKPLD